MGWTIAAEIAGAEFWLYRPDRGYRFGSGGYIHWLAEQCEYKGVRPFGDLLSSFRRSFRRVADEHGVSANSRIAVTTETVTDKSDRGMVQAAEILCRWIRRAGYDPVKIEIDYLFFENGRTVASLSLPKQMIRDFQHQMDYGGERPKCKILEAEVKVRINQDYCFPFYGLYGYAISRALSTWVQPQRQKNRGRAFQHPMQKI